MIEDVLKEQGLFVRSTSGYSMYPMLRDRKDTVVIVPCEGRLKKYDVPLYKSEGRYILHRIIEVRPDSYVIRGDNCMRTEYGITDADILGVLKTFYRDDKEVNMNGIGYKLYVRIWHHSFVLRKIIRKMREKLRNKGAE